LLPDRRRAVGQIDHFHLRQLPSLRRAVNYSLSLADLDPKEAYGPLGMDKATWSRISNGTQSFPADALGKLKEITGNEAPLFWLAYSQGYELRPLRSELEEQIAAKDARIADLEKRIEHITDFMKQTRSGG
jgi:plasmid maintenance system antidote protein VapI